MSIWDFMHSSPWLSFFLALIVASVIKAAIVAPFKIANRWIRHRNVAARGWPPAHLDADGDFRPAEEPEEAP